MRSPTNERNAPHTTENEMMSKLERRLRSFEALQIALAIEDAKHMPTTPEIERQADSLYAAGRRYMAQLRYAENAMWPVTVVSGEIRPAIRALGRAEVIAQLAELRAKHPQLQYAHRDCETISDHDLRSMLEDATRLTEGKE
jgi:hypothetical protein